MIVKLELNKSHGDHKKAALEAVEAVSIMHLPLTDNFVQSTVRAGGARSLPSDNKFNVRAHTHKI